ncbi:DNA primase [uncultured phage_Deep1-GF2-KM23-C739]|uniref:DNA helicase/primase n=1 Tax=uncultured phage_Deep1-GF2-KM23-C739 TaxID=2740798 RepID=A0A1B1IVW5_9CAUD|nr:DNA primase [uncultured phage_Deep1-GF2-KM23-C739]ANS05490.1 DNA primase [uncultured phage_Deep1-GF2-KM23-C739]
MMNETDEEVTFLHYEQCPECRTNHRDNAGDNLAMYSDGHGYCFSCHYFEKSEDEVNKEFPKDTNMITGEYKNLTKRKIDEQTCKHFGYQIGNYNNQPVHIAPYYNKEHELIAQHIRFPNKKFIWLGDMDEVGLFGQNKWRDSGKMLVVCEGELDCMSVSKVQGNRWPVVSVPSGSASAKKYIKKSLEWLEKFENVIFLYDSDAAGKRAAVECAKLLSPRKAKIGRLPLKDANEMLVKEKTRELVDSIWGASTYTPEGIISGEDTWELLIRNDKKFSVPYLWEGLNTKLKGIRVGEIVTLTAGSGTGKSQICREIAYDLISKGNTIGYIGLEEDVSRSIRGLVSIPLNKLVHQDEIREKISEEELKVGWKKVKSKCYFFDHFGSTESGNLLNKIRYLVRGCDCKYIVVDHLNIIVSALDIAPNENERRVIDKTMTNLRTLVEELKFGLILVAHLKRPDGKYGHEEGAITSLSHLRGSHAIAQLSDIVVGCERNQQSEENKDTMTVRVLKNRYTGETGICTYLHYDKETGRLSEGKFNAEEEIRETH